MAPFNAFVQKEQVDVGQLVGPQMPIATLIGTDEFWIQTSVPVAKLSWMNLPSKDRPTGAQARIVHQSGSGIPGIERRGAVIRMLSDLDPKSRLARLIVKVSDPLEQNTAPEERKGPLLLGSFVHVVLTGKKLKGVSRIPRRALRDDRHIWVVGRDSTLHIRAVSVLWRTRDYVLVQEQFGAGDQIVVSTLSPVVSGMKVRLSGRSTEEAKANERTP
jgi:hypothetical protein